MQTLNVLGYFVLYATIVSESYLSGNYKHLFLFKFLPLQTVLAAKEIELEQYKSLVEELNQQINGLQMDTDKTSLAVLQQVRNSDLCEAVLAE